MNYCIGPDWLSMVLRLRQHNIVRQNYYKHNITTAGTWWHVDHTHKTFKLYDLYCDLGWDENKQGQIMIAK